MAYATGSDPYLQLALVAGIGAVAASALMLVAVAVLRARLATRRARERRLVEQWRPVLARCVEAPPDALPRLARRDREPFLRLWNHFHESLRGPAGDQLNRLAIALGMDRAARDMLVTGPLHGRLLAAVTLGNLRDAQATDLLRGLVESPSVPLSLTAAHALMRIDAGSALAWLLPLAGAREDWPVARLAAMLAEAGADAVSPALAGALREATRARDSAARLPRLLKLARFAHPEQIGSAVREALDAASSDEVIAACVATLADPRDIEVLRRHARHPRWFVRVATARSLGRLATAEDSALLVELLHDPEWWVRYRAAQALAALPAIDTGRLRESLRSREAAQMLDHVIAERT